MSGWLDDIKEFIFETIINGIRWFLDKSNELFAQSVNTVRENVSETPKEFSKLIVENLREVSTAAILPVAGLILTYIFCYELYKFVVQQNRGNDFEIGQLLFLIIKTSVMIYFLTHSFDITLAFFDLGKWITDKVPDKILVLPASITDNLVNSIPENDIGTALGTFVVTCIVMIATFIMSIIIYLVAWSRMVTILLYISVAPIPFATFMNSDWIGSVGQTYLKNLIALMLQGYFMLICLIVYAGLLDKATHLMKDSGFFGLVLMIVSMAILVVSLTRTHTLAKSVMGVA